MAGYLTFNVPLQTGHFFPVDEQVKQCPVGTAQLLNWKAYTRQRGGQYCKVLNNRKTEEKWNQVYF